MLPSWQAEAIRALTSSGMGEAVVAVIHRDSSPNGAGPTRPGNGVPLDRVAPAARIVDYGSQADPAPIPDDLDFALDLRSSTVEPGGLVARLGVWAFAFGEGDPSPESALQRALRDGSTVISFQLVGTEQAGTPARLRRGVVRVERHSPRRSLDRLVRAASALPLQCARDAGDSPPDLTSLPVPTAAPDRLRRSGWSRVVRWTYGAFVLKQWAVGLADGPPEELLKGRVGRVQWIAARSRRSFYADPMVVPGSDGRIILCEELDYSDGFGTVTRLEVDEAGEVRTDVVVSDPESHLSYPGLVQLDDGWLCIPEAAMTGRVRGFRLTADTRRALGEVTLAAGIPAIDPTVFFHAGRWWMLCTHDGWSSPSHLWLYHADHPLGEWTPHRKNPVVVDVRAARPAGPPLAIGGELYRVSQDCADGYGSAVTITRVTALDEEDFREEYVTTLRPDRDGSRPGGLHTVSHDGNHVVIDGYRNVFHPLAGWFRLKAMLRARRHAVHVTTWP